MLLGAMLGLVACQAGDDGVAARSSTTTMATDAPTTGATREEAGEPPAVGIDDVSPPVTRPPWLETRILPRTAEGYGEVQPTPPELEDRVLPTIDFLPPPDGDGFASAVVPVPDDVVSRSTWAQACPVGLADLRYVTVSFWGFDGRPHTGELLVHADVAGDLVEVFRRLHAVRFPIEEMRITRVDELDAPPTGDGNNTSAFVCRPSRGATSWSEHAFGRAVDVNPFHNPYLSGGVVLPELASAYADRSRVRAGMILADDAVTSAFADVGWEWGGSWRSSKDYMHFSVNGR